MSQNKENDPSDLKFLIITHTFATGPAQELRDFLIKKKMSLSFLEHPFSFNKNEKRSRMTYFREGTEEKLFKGIKIKGPDLFYFIKDFFYTIYFTIKMRRKYDICIAADNLNSFSAYFLKKLGYIKKLVYYTIDYTPKRFDNKLLNRIYHWVDRFCCFHSDLLWDSSIRMKMAREKNGVNMDKCTKGIVVHDGCHFNGIERLPDEKVNRFKLVYMGHLTKGVGVDLAIKSMPEILKKYPKLTLTIIGGGSYKIELEKLAKELNLEERVIFTGFVESHKDLEKTIASCGVALAPYVPDPNSVTFFSDSGKPKVYMACGLPVLLTSVPEIALEIERRRAGLIFDYNKEDLLEKLSYLLEDEKMYMEYRSNAIKFAKELDWDIVFKNALQESFVFLS